MKDYLYELMTCDWDIDKDYINVRTKRCDSKKGCIISNKGSVKFDGTKALVKDYRVYTGVSTCDIKICIRKYTTFKSPEIIWSNKKYYLKIDAEIVSEFNTVGATSEDLSWWLKKNKIKEVYVPSTTRCGNTLE